VLLPLRAFLGITFVFAGLQKLADPAFFNAANPASIQAQLAGAQRTSPIHGLMGPLTHVAVPVGLAIAFAEVAVGLGTLLGLWARLAAAGGMLLSFLLFLTVSFHSHPYYTGSDIVFVFAWAPLLVAGAGGVLAADAVLAHRARRQIGAEPVAIVPTSFAAVRRVCGSYEDGRCQVREGEPCAPGPCPYLAQRPPPLRRIDQEELDRRTFVARGVAAGAVSAFALVAGGVAAGLGRLGGTPSGAVAQTLGTSSASSTTTSSAPAPNGPTTTVPARPAGTRIGPARDVPVGGAASFQDPSSGDPSLVVRPQAGTFLAFDAVCPHAGCTVQYDPTHKLFICPCHGSEFNGRTGAVEVGPAQQGLTRLRIAEGSDGQLYV
jgi:thiosulfate dehydrogenase [quinone] large subunit